MRIVSLKNIAVTFLFALVMLAGSQAMAQEADTATPTPAANPAAVDQPDTVPAEPAPVPAETAPAPAETAPAPAEPAPVPAEPAPAPAEAAPATDTAPAAETAPVQTETPETDMTAPEVDKPATTEVKQKSTWTLVDRISVGVLGSDMAAEYGFQAEWSAPHFGVSFFWANMQPYPDKTDFNWDLGWVFHYYPLGHGPGSLYVGPGFCLVHLERDRDPFRLLVADPIAVKSGMARFEGRQRQKFELIGPIAEIGYRHTFLLYKSFGITLGIGAAGGYLFSDQVRYYSNSAYFAVTPQFGFSW